MGNLRWMGQNMNKFYEYETEKKISHLVRYWMSGSNTRVNIKILIAGTVNVVLLKGY